MGANGYYGIDNVTIGNITASGQVVELATAVTGVTSNFDGCDGIIGLGFKNLEGSKLAGPSLLHWVVRICALLTTQQSLH